MNNQEAQFILHAYRPDGRDAQDPQFAEALEQVRRDPALRTWFDQQRAEDGALSRKLQSASVPADLHTRILAGRKTLPAQVLWRRRPLITALAACLLVVAGLALFWRPAAGSGSFAVYRDEMVGYVSELEQGRHSLQFKAADLDQIRQWINENTPQAGACLPAGLASGTGIGCRVVEWHGCSVLLACFKTDAGVPAHLLVIDSCKLKEAPAPGLRLASATRDMNTDAWSAGGKTYLLVSRAPADTLERLL